MVPVLKMFAPLLAAFAVLAFRPAVTYAQSTPKANLKFIAQKADVDDATLDGVAKELLARGKTGLAVQQVRSEVLALLSETNSCSDWFLSAEPAAQEKFRSLHFDIDPAGSSEILKIEGAQARTDYYHPYVARTRQAVGLGSTITLNANGAFFKASAYVRDLSHPGERNSFVTFRALLVGNYSGGSPEARLLTVLHEFGHIVDLLPVDFGEPSAAFLSVQNTAVVLHHCNSQIHDHAKHLRLSESLGKVLSPNLADRTARQTFNP